MTTNASRLFARRVAGLIFMAFAAWSFANFGQMVKQRVGERDWFVQHPNAFQKSAHLNFYCLVGFAALLFLAAMLMIFAPDSAMGMMESFLDIGFADPPGRSFFQLRSEWIGTHCSLPENFEERSCTASMSLADWVQWFFLDHFGTAGMYTLALCAMVTVWAYCVKQLHDHADDPAWQQAISGQRLYAGKVQRVELDSILTAGMEDDTVSDAAGGGGGGGAQRSDAAAGAQ